MAGGRISATSAAGCGTTPSRASTGAPTGATNRSAPDAPLTATNPICASGSARSCGIPAPGCWPATPYSRFCTCWTWRRDPRPANPQRRSSPPTGRHHSRQRQRPTAVTDSPPIPNHCLGIQPFRGILLKIYLKHTIEY